MVMINKRNLKIHNAHNKFLCGDFESCISLLEEAVEDKEYDKEAALYYANEMYRHLDKKDNTSIRNSLDDLVAQANSMES